MGIFYENHQGYEAIAQRVANREREVAEYDMTIASLEKQLECVKGHPDVSEMPDRLKRHVPNRTDGLVADPGMTEDDIELVCKCQHKLHIRSVLSGSKRERAKAKASLDADTELLMAIPAAERNAAINRVKEKLQNQGG